MDSDAMNVVSNRPNSRPSRNNPPTPRDVNIQISNGSSHFQNPDDLPYGETSLIPGKLLLKLPIAAEPGTCVLKTSTVNSDHTKFAVALSNKRVKIYDVHGKLWDEYEHEKDVTHIKFSRANPPILLTSSSNGKIQVWDTRCQGPVQTFLDDSSGELKPILSFDCNKNDELLCAGTEVIREDSFLLFWDPRTSDLLGGYWNSHAGDITQVNFHPKKRSVLGSSSVDGLINVFDVNKETEDDALLYTLNVEAPVNTFNWRLYDTISCTTSIENFHMWCVSDVKPELSIPRQNFQDVYKIDVDYFIDCIEMSFLDRWYIATGNNKGEVHLWNSANNTFYPIGFKLEGGHSDVVRSVCYNITENVAVTGGDDGCICFWKLSEDSQPFMPVVVDQSSHHSCLP